MTLLQGGRALVRSLAVLAAAGCGDTQSALPPPQATLVDEDVEVTAALGRELERGRRAIEAFFGAPIPEPFAIEILPDRAAFDASFPPEWGVAETECWMVATGVADALRILSPRVWGTDACEHDPDDAAHVQGIVTHELTHVYHGQLNPTRDFTGAEELGWFAEGLAVVVSGQLDQGHRASAAKAVRSGAVPARLADAWSGPHRYGVCGTMVLLIDELLGRAGLITLLSATRQDEVLRALELSEDEFLAEWAAFVEITAR